MSVDEGLSKEIRPGTKLHTDLLEHIRTRVQYSERKMQSYKKSWDEADASMKAYIKESDYSKAEKEAQQERKKSFDKTDYVTLEVPYSYAMISTLHTYFASIFLSRTPVYQVTGRHAEAQHQVMAMEAYLDYQFRVGEHSVPLFNWLYDMSKYGLGVMGNYWDRETVTTSVIEKVPKTLAGIPLPGKFETRMVATEVVGFQGARVFNVRPHDFRPDPRCSISNFQKGEFCGRVTSAGWHELEGNSTLINLDILYKHLNKKKSSEGNEYSKDPGNKNLELPYQPGEGEEDPRLAPGSVPLIEMYVRINPKRWKLASSDRNEIWKFVLADNEILIQAKPLGLYHNRFPYSVMEFGMGSEEFVKRPLMDYIRPLSDTLTWLFNSHFYAVRTALNDKRLVDPTRVVMSDVYNLDRNVIRLRPEAYGTPLKDALMQLDVRDPTSQHLGSAQYVETMIQRVGGIVDNLMGVVNQGGRKTATEVRNSTGMATNRLKTPAEYNSALGWSPLIQQIISNTQQNYDGQMKLRLAGDLYKGEAVEVTPESLAGFYDFVPVDGTLPVDRLAQANFWKELIGMLASSEQAAMTWDLNSMIQHAMQLQGERNISKFKIQVSPNEQLMQQALAGNVVPLGGEGGGPRTQGSSGGT